MFWKFSKVLRDQVSPHMIMVLFFRLPSDKYNACSPWYHPLTSTTQTKYRFGMLQIFGRKSREHCKVETSPPSSLLTWPGQQSLELTHVPSEHSVCVPAQTNRIDIRGCRPVDNIKKLNVRNIPVTPLLGFIVREHRFRKSTSL